MIRRRGPDRGRDCPGNGAGRSVAGWPVARRACVRGRNSHQPAPPSAPGRASPPGPEEETRVKRTFQPNVRKRAKNHGFRSPHVHPGRSRHPAQPSPEGPGQAVGLIRPIRDRRTFVALRATGPGPSRAPVARVPRRRSRGCAHPAGLSPSPRRVGGRWSGTGSAGASGRSSPIWPPPVPLVRSPLVSAGLRVRSGPRPPDELRNDVVRLLEALETPARSGSTGEPVDPRAARPGPSSTSRFAPVDRRPAATSPRVRPTPSRPSRCTGRGAARGWPSGASVAATRGVATAGTLFPSRPLPATPRRRPGTELPDHLSERTVA
jgi:hypothetical protein